MKDPARASRGSTTGAPNGRRLAPVSDYQWVVLGLITLLAAILRLAYIGRVSPDPFYDAAVRSMGLSWHNFFFGAFEPAGSVSIDKPPIDLWLQVISVKLFGFSSTMLKLPEIFAGIASVPLLFAVVRRMWSTRAGLAAATAMAVLPVEVLTARSDTMDAVMMMLIVLGLLLLVRAAQSGRHVWLLAAAAALGVAFNVKLLESLIALPGLALYAYLALPGRPARRIRPLAAAGAVYLAISLSWLTATLLFPANERPWAIGSSNGSAWNAAFVFNGTERLGGKSPEPQFTVYQPGRHYPTATQSQRDHIPILPASPTRLLTRVGPLSGERLGFMLLFALLLGVPALAWSVVRYRPGEGEPYDPLEEPAGGPPGASARDEATAPDEPAIADAARLRRAAAAGLGLWLLTGIVLFSYMSRLHPRYVEAFTPAVAAVLGIGLAWAAAPRGGRARLGLLLLTLLIATIYGERLLYGTPGAWWITLFGALGAGALAVLARAPSLSATLRSRLAPTGVLALTLLAALAISLGTDRTLLRDGVTDAGYVGALPTREQNRLSSFLRGHQGRARYELAAESATQIGSLIVQDARPVLILTTYNARVFTDVPRLQRLIAEGQVRYAFINTFCSTRKRTRGSSTRSQSQNAACAAPAKWIRAHGTDVSRAAGLGHRKVLWLLPGATP